jgi:hypothetical protein
VIPQPQKRPRSSWRRFCAEQPNQRWQADITHWQLVDGSQVEILNILDDHSRVCIASMARRIFTGTQVWQVFPGTTGSTAGAQSPCGTTAGCTTSALAPA